MSAALDSASNATLADLRSDPAARAKIKAQTTKLGPEPQMDWFSAITGSSIFELGKELLRKVCRLL